MASYQKTPEQILEEFKTTDKGLSKEEAQKRLLEYGPNELKATKKETAWQMFFEQFKSLMIIILIVASIISAAFGEINDAIVIIVIVIINAIVGFVQEHKAEKALEALMAMAAPKARVIREGREMTVPTREVVLGDILSLEAGDRIPADARIIKAIELRTQEAPLTGESNPRSKCAEAINKTNLVVNDQKNMIFSGTDISQGRAIAVVVRTGMETEFGKVARLTQEIKKGKTTLQKELDVVGKFIGKVTLGICIIVFFGELIQEGSVAGNIVVNAFLFAVALAVAAVPEGLPATITVTLAIGVQRLVKKNVIIKKLNAVETLGSTSVICSDKTGTLTKNEMTVKEIFLSNDFIQVSGVGYIPEGQFIKNQSLIQPEKDHNLMHLLTIATACNNANIIKEDGHHLITGDPTEAALLVAAKKTGIDRHHLEDTMPRLHEFPFDSTRKMMSTIIKQKNSQLVCVKGAPDEILKKCRKIVIQNSIIHLTEQRKRQIVVANEQMAADALRVLGFAYKELPNTTKTYKQEDTENDLIFVGLMGMIDPPREEVKEAIKDCHRAGISVYIITGDYGTTAKAIAKQIGLATEKTKVIEGALMNKLSDEELQNLLHEPIIFARVSPEHKLRVVEVLEKMGHIVAVTGDGVNDAPALKKSNIGVAMGIIGTDVSKEAADMILTDDSFASIVAAIREGRGIYANIKKFLRYLFSSNLGEIITVFVGLLIGAAFLILASQILWVNLATVLLPALALGVEPVETNVMEQKPRNEKERIITKKIFLQWLVMGAIMGLGTLAVFITYLLIGGWQWGTHLTVESTVYLKALTMSFSTLVIFQMVNVLNCKSDDKSIFKVGFFSNKWLLGSIVLSVILQIMAVQLPFFQKYLSTVSLSWLDWSIVFGVSLSILFYDEIRKGIMKKEAIV